MSRASDVDQVLDADGNAVQRPAVAAGGKLLPGPRGLVASLVGETRSHDGVERTVVALDPLQAGFRDRRRCQPRRRR